ncbi:hypothetical protein RB195_004345 [Necator americanus]|uniref:Uncharacterized protein n=1 Tax=Necator americanus TaxID=51031 RepID=A0ABR1BM15_NECAM
MEITLLLFLSIDEMLKEHRADIEEILKMIDEKLEKLKEKEKNIIDVKEDHVSSSGDDILEINMMDHTSGAYQDDMMLTELDTHLEDDKNAKHSSTLDIPKQHGGKESTISSTAMRAPNESRVEVKIESFTPGHAIDGCP